MKIAGFTFIRNALMFDYPVVESIRSALPLCDHFVVAVGKSQDATLDLVRSIGDPRLHIIETIWDDHLRKGGRVLAAETNKAFDAIPKGFDWCLYIQADECLHEKDYEGIRDNLEKYVGDVRTQGWLFNYLHFYGSYDFVGTSRRWYRREVRVVRQDPLIRSFRDAQGFRRAGKKLHVRCADAHIYHYGWVKNPAIQHQKQLNFNKLWHSDLAVHRRFGNAGTYTYNDREPLERFSGTHPKVMTARIEAINWQFDNDPSAIRLSIKERMSRWIEKHSGWRPGEYKNYCLIR